MPDFEAELRSAFDPETKRLTVPEEWEGFPGTAFGGFVAGASLVAASSEAAYPRPLSFHARYHRPVPTGRAVEVAITHQRKGRLVDAINVELTSEGKLLTFVSTLFGQHGEAPLDKQGIEPMAPLNEPEPIWKFLDAAGIPPPPLMRRVGFRGESVAPEGPSEPSDWHMRGEWPATPSEDLAVRAAIALMPIDNAVGASAMVANELDLNGEWPVSMPSLDLSGWFYRPEARPEPADGGAGWLRTRTSTPVSWAGYAVGRTQVWAGDLLAAEGMSQVALLPAPTWGVKTD